MSLENQIPHQYSLPWTDRNGFTHWSIALFWIIASFLLFQLFGSLVSVILLYYTSSEPLNLMELTSQLQDNLELVFVGNSVSQILFLGLGTWMITRLNSSKSQRRSYLRMQHSGGGYKLYLGIVLLMIVIQPLIWFLSWINVQIPVSESLMQLEEMQTQLMEDFLRGNNYIVWTFIHIGIVPSICEEILYRGFTLRALEKSWGPVAAIVVSGVIFGVYHLRLTQALPLALIGILLGYIAWATSSIFPAMIAHLVNNGGSVLTLYFFPDLNFAELSPERMPPVWLTLLSIGATLTILYALKYLTRTGLYKQKYQHYEHV